MKNLIVAQSGGPTATINATLCGVIEQAKKLKIDNIDIIDITENTTVSLFIE